MPTFKAKILGDWIQIAASVGVVLGIVLLIVAIADSTPAPIPAGGGRPPLPPAEHYRPAPPPVTAPGPISTERRAELTGFIDQHCPVCHGSALAGGIGPALSGDTLEHLSANAVAFTILHGRPAKGMPPWEIQLTEQDALWMAGFLKRRRELQPFNEL